MAAPPRHPLFAALILDLSSAKDVTYKNRSSPLAATGPIYLANRLYEWARRSRKRHVHIHEAGRIYGSPWLETGTHRFARAHPCSFDAPRARIARLEALRPLRMCGSPLAVCLVSFFVSVCRSCVSSSSVLRPPIPRWCPVRA